MDIILAIWSGKVIGPLAIIKDSKYKYSLILQSIFLFIVSNNLLGLYTTGRTSNILNLLSLSFSLIIGSLIQIALDRRLIKKFNDPNIPLLIRPFIILVEVFSFLLRIITLSFRLCTNILAGHMILHIISNLSLIGIIPLTLLEIAVSLIQSFVFLLLSSTYLKEL